MSKNEYYTALTQADSFLDREKLVHKYSWAIPNNEALNIIAKYAPIVEIGAGLGYWAFLLRERGVVIRAFDNKTYMSKSRPLKEWTKVKWGDPSILKKYPDYTLFLCWPPYATKMASCCLNYYRGKTVIYIGEGDWGCTANDTYHKKLEKQFKCIMTAKIPQWFGLHDYLSVWERITKQGV